jgi:hypothetical protein
MTIKGKAEEVGIEVEKLAALAAAAGIDASDVNRTLEPTEAMRLGKAVKNLENSSNEEAGEPKDIRFWTTNTNHTIGKGIVGPEAVYFKDHSLILNSKSDAKLIGNIRKLRAKDIFELSDEPFDEDSDAFYAFSKLIDSELFTGQSGEPSKRGLKAIRAMFSGEELIDMSKHAFDPQRLKMKALRTKSAVRLINNGK